MEYSPDECLTYDDVTLVPQYSNIKSRNDVDTSVEFSENLKLKIPIISSPMDTVTEPEMAIALDKCGGLGIIHRACTIDDQVVMVKSITSAEHDNYPTINFGAAIGVTGDYIERAAALYDHGCNILCIDVAHGHHENVAIAIESLRKAFKDNIHIMAGNVATREGFDFLADAGADSIRVCIGSGAACTTKIMTGHGVPALSSIIDCAQSTRKALLIADGGIRSSGDIVKAIAAGADLVMLGSLLAGCDEAPGVRFGDSGRKLYRGMASGNVKKLIGHDAYIEGVTGGVNCTGSVASTVDSLMHGVRSGMSYSGARTLSKLRSKARFIKQTNHGVAEGHSRV